MQDKKKTFKGKRTIQSIIVIRLTINRMKRAMLAALLSATKVVSILDTVRISHIRQNAKKAIRKETLKN
jgi:hypothetical protein